ncbi:MAG: DUF2490 domain-containing protein [Sphingobacteriaceae bacterium]
MLLPLGLMAQETRVSDANFINWLQTLNTISFNDKWSLQVEYQLRRAEGFKIAQQHLVRFGANFKWHENIVVQGGYAWVSTHPYGDFPIAAAGTFPEHRLYEQFLLKQQINKWSFAHRFRLEQRWLAKMSAVAKGDIESWIFLNRFRYQFKVQRTLFNWGKKQTYLAIADEIFIGSGKNLGLNIFDQNRFLVQLGLKFNKNYSFELGYLNQILQQGKRVENQTIVQRNNGLVFSSVLNF